jgi:3-hydroxyacyl-[acyl-carrier-protein] dehydratase
MGMTEAGGGAGQTLDVDAIKAILPHRYPFLLVDRVREWEVDRRLVAIKNVTVNEPFFQGHFPGRPIMPGVLMLEALAQAGGILSLKSVPPGGRPVVFLTGVDGAKFRRPVVPGDQLRLEVEVVRKRPPFWKMQGKVYVEAELVCEAEMTAMVTEEKAEGTAAGSAARSER